jgi:arsenate reductase
VITLYGIPNCDTVKRARAFLAERGVAHAFHDFRKQGVPTELLADWLETIGWERLLNRQGTTWRRLDAARQAAVHDAETAGALMLEEPSVIKRPVVVRDGRASVGFDAAQWGTWAG